MVFRHPPHGDFAQAPVAELTSLAMVLLDKLGREFRRRFAAESLLHHSEFSDNSRALISAFVLI
jgi:hypothetical protein